MSQRPSVDVVVPVAGDAERVRAVLERMRSLDLRPGDTLTVVDNRGVGVLDPEVLAAPEVRTSYFARNRGAARGTGEWLVFLDADVEPADGLLDALLVPPPGDELAVLAGTVRDEPGAATPAVRYAELKGAMSQASTLSFGAQRFAQTAHAAVRRRAFVAVGGFAETARSGGDADLCWRLAAAGWEIAARPEAVVVHRNRATMRGMLGQRFRHGTGAGWLARRWPGAFPPRRWPGLIRWGLLQAAGGVRAGARGDRDALLVGLLDGPAVWAFELGRWVPNRPLRKPARPGFLHR